MQASDVVFTGKHATELKLQSRGNGRAVRSPENDEAVFPALRTALWKTPMMRGVSHIPTAPAPTKGMEMRGKGMPFLRRCP